MCKLSYANNPIAVGQFSATGLLLVVESQHQKRSRKILALELGC
jgi:hypothetical protein